MHLFMRQATGDPVLDHWPGIEARRWRGHRRFTFAKTSWSTFAIGIILGNLAPARTPTACCGGTPLNGISLADLSQTKVGIDSSAAHVHPDARYS